MTDSFTIELTEPVADADVGGATRRREVPPARPCGTGATVSLPPDEFRAELACGCQAGAEDELIGPYEEGFAAYASGTGLADNPYPGDNCAHQQWANGWSQARDEAQRQAR